LFGGLLNAQPVFVPDVMLRQFLNDFVPGAVDVNGYIDPSNPDVAATVSLDLPFHWTPVDLAGIEAFKQLQTLKLGKASFVMNPMVLSVSAWPADLKHLEVVGSTGALPVWPSTLEYLGLYGDQTSAGQFYPAYPAGLDSLRFFPVDDIPAVPAIPAGLSYLAMTAPIVDTEAPALPVGLTFLSLWGYTFSTAPTWPTGLETLQMQGCDIPSGLSVLPSGLVILDLWGCSIPGGVQTLPAGLEKVAFNEMQDSPIQISAWPNSVDDIQIQTDMSLVDLPVWPLGLVNLSLVDLPLLAVLDTFPSTLATLFIRALPSVTSIPSLPPTLTSFYAVDLQVQSLPDMPPTVNSISLGTLPNLGCIPLLPQGLIYLELNASALDPITLCLPNLPNSLSVIGYGSSVITPDPSMLCTVLNSTCPFVNPMVNGTVYWDANANGIRDLGETGYPFATVNVQPGNYTYGVSPDGSFGLPLPVGTYTLSANGASPYVQSILPAGLVADLDSATSMSNGNDFGVVLQPGIQDLRIDAQFQVARPGFDDLATITFSNVGSTTMSGSVSFTFDADQTWVSADVTPSALNGNLASWSFSGLAVGETRVIHVTLHTDVSVALGTPLTHVVVVDPVVSDETPADNELVVDTEVVGSFDPNDKQVTPTVATPADVSAGEELTYTIRFQNTGTYLAERVLITDTLSADLQWSTMRFISSSHPCTWVLLDNGVLRFTFDQIMLPDSNSNEPASHGFVKFAMEAATTLLNGAQVGNIANIHFDFNEPVITNEALFTVDLTSGLSDAVEPDDLRLWPDPASDVLFIAHRTEGVRSVRLLDMRGRTLLAVGAVDHLDVGQLATGMYVVRVTTPTATYVRSVMKR